MDVYDVYACNQHGRTDMYFIVSKNWAFLFLSELRQISNNFNFNDSTQYCSTDSCVNITLPPDQRLIS